MNPVNISEMVKVREQRVKEKHNLLGTDVLRRVHRHFLLLSNAGL